MHRIVSPFLAIGLVAALACFSVVRTYVIEPVAWSVHELGRLVVGFVPVRREERREMLFGFAVTAGNRNRSMARYAVA